MKICTSCKVSKLECSFYKSTAVSSGYEAQCKTCRSSQRRALYLKNKHDPVYRRKQRLGQIKIREKYKQFIINLKSKPCCDSGKRCYLR